LLLPVCARSQVVVDLQIIPPGKQLTCSGQTYRCFEFEEWKQIILADAELVASRAQLAALHESMDFLHQQFEVLNEVNVSLSASNDLLTVELRRSYEENDRLAREVLTLSTPKAGPWIVFVAGLVLLGTGLGTIIGSQVQ
jgi:hypothetical protein